MGHHEDMHISVKAGNQIAGVTIPGEARQLLELGDADHVRMKLKEVLLRWFLTQRMGEANQELRQQLEEALGTVQDSD